MLPDLGAALRGSHRSSGIRKNAPRETTKLMRRVITQHEHFLRVRLVHPLPLVCGLVPCPRGRHPSSHSETVASQCTATVVLFRTKALGDISLMCFLNASCDGTPFVSSPSSRTRTSCAELRIVSHTRRTIASNASLSHHHHPSHQSPPESA